MIINPYPVTFDIEDADTAKLLDSCIDELELKQQAVLIRRFGLRGHFATTLDEVGKQMGLTRERVRQIQMMALRKLQRILKNRGLGKDILEK